MASLLRLIPWLQLDSVALKGLWVDANEGDVERWSEQWLSQLV